MANYHASGAINCVDSAPLGVPDGLEGEFDANGYERVLIDDSTYTGLYDPTGAIRVSDQSAAVDVTGTYDVDGALNAVFVDGTALVGTYSPVGARNYFLQT